MAGNRTRDPMPRAPRAEDPSEPLPRSPRRRIRRLTPG
jgi:hypothetical protein